MTHRHQHQEFSELLPFLANDTLRGGERERIEEHLASCLSCRAELAQERRLLRAFRSSDAAEHLIDDGFERVVSRARGLSSRPASGWRRWGQATQRLVARRAMLAALLVGVVIGVEHIESSATLTEQRFHTLSQDHGTVVGADIVYVAFDAAASRGAIDAALAAVRGEVVSGPNHDNVFTVRVPATAVASAVSALKSRSGIRFVAPAAPDSAP